MAGGRRKAGERDVEQVNLVYNEAYEEGDVIVFTFPRTQIEVYGTDAQ